jgi:hypothetical protein
MPSGALKVAPSQEKASVDSHPLFVRSATRMLLLPVSAMYSFDWSIATTTPRGPLSRPVGPNILLSNEPEMPEPEAVCTTPVFR